MSPLPNALSPAEWHTRFLVQAKWTHENRLRLYQKVKIGSTHRVLEVGCGTGVLTAELHHLTWAQIHGVDLAADFLNFAGKEDRKTQFILGDGLALPYRSAIFDLSLCQFYLLWVHDPLQALVEMKRITRPGHPIIALAEPDYGGRIDYPIELEELGRLQTEGLRRQGANPLIGRELAALFSKAGLKQIETGLLGGEWRHPIPPNEWGTEWTTLAVDLVNLAPPNRIRELCSLDQAAWRNGDRVLFVPTFYALGWVD